MQASTLERYDQRRSFNGKPFKSLCYAPFTSLFLEQSGDVRVCCHNWENPAGNILKNTIDEIWSGAAIKLLRDALSAYKFGPGCDFCYHRMEEGSYDNLAMERFEGFDVASEAPAWPKQMEFALSNSCNLECVMCSGFYSS